MVMVFVAALVMAGCAAVVMVEVERDPAQSSERSGTEFKEIVPRETFKTFTE